MRERRESELQREKGEQREHGDEREEYKKESVRMGVRRVCGLKKFQFQTTVNLYQHTKYYKFAGRTVNE